jgi:hypothetical protein
VQPRSPAQDTHLLAQLGLDKGVDDNGGPPFSPLDGKAQVVDGLDPRMPDFLELLVRELRLERVHESGRGLTGGVGDDVQLDGRFRHMA